MAEAFLRGECRTGEEEGGLERGRGEVGSESGSGLEEALVERMGRMGLRGGEGSGGG